MGISDENVKNMEENLNEIITFYKNYNENSKNNSSTKFIRNDSCFFFS